MSARWDDIKGCRVTVPKHVVFRDLARETVILNIRTGTYHGIDHIGARFFETMRSTSALTAASTALAEEFGQPLDAMQSDLATFCDDMVQAGLVELEPSVPIH